MKLIMSPEKEEGESFPFTPHSSKGAVKKEKDRDRMQPSKSPKKKTQQSRDPLPVVGKEVEVEGKKAKINIQGDGSDAIYSQYTVNSMLLFYKRSLRRRHG